MEDGWQASAGAWITEQGSDGDYARRYVLDAPMLALATAHGARRALDVGCGEGRFCRMLRARGIDAIGIDPTLALLDVARARDPGGDYRAGRAETLPFEDAGFDLVVSYLSLIDIAELPAAIAEMARVLRPGGALLIANLASHVTAAAPDYWMQGGGRRGLLVDRYLEERAEWAVWNGIRVRNWHRPLSTYMRLLLGQGLVLRHFDEPAAQGGDPARSDRLTRCPWFLVMEWARPAA